MADNHNGEEEHVVEVEADAPPPKPSNIAVHPINQNTFTLNERLGLNEFFLLDVWRASIAELLGSAVFVFMFDTIVISTYESEAKDPNLIMSILVAISLIVLRVTIFPISGGHVSPVITFSSALLGLISMSRALVYILAQCIGAVFGALALKAVISNSTANDWSLGGCTITIITPEGQNGIGTSQAFSLEVICTFVLLFASVWAGFDLPHAKKLGSVLVLVFIGTVVGLLTFISTTLTTKRGYSGVGMNPARCLGPAIVRGGHLWDGHWIFWVGPTVACFAFYFYTKIIPKEHFFLDGTYKHDFFAVINAALIMYKST